MKKLSYFLFTALAALAMIFSSLGTVTAFATTEQTYDIVLTKVKLSEDSLKNFPKGEGKDSYTGAKLDSGTYFGTEDTLPGVFFKVYQYSDSAADHIGAAAEGTVVEGRTDANGQIRFTGLKEGKYIIVEDKTKSTIAGKEELANSKAVPVVVELPVYKAEGGTFTTGDNALYVYPKNTVDKPSIDKVVSEDAKHDTALIGETKTFKVTSTMPEGIKDYKKLTFTDKFSAGLTYTGNLVVKNGNTVVDPSNYSTDGTSAVGTKAAAISIAFKEDYIKTLNPKDVITITYDAVINEEAVMGAANPNDVKLTYGTNPDSTKEVKPDENPELHTGGAKFVKKDQTTKAALKDAEFKVTNTEGKYLKQTVSNGKVVKNEWVSSQNDGTVIKSNNNGEFEVKGLPYGTAGNKNTEGSTTYKLVETKAPTGYALLTNAIEFTVSSDSYSNAQKLNTINNNKVTIPQTGGIGSALVIAAGVLVVGLGFIAKRRSAK